MQTILKLFLSSKIKSLRIALSGVDEKPRKKAPIHILCRGFLFYSLLTEAVSTLGFKVADCYGACLGAIVTISLLLQKILAMLTFIYRCFVISICLRFLFCKSSITLFLVHTHTTSVTSVNV